MHDVENLANDNLIQLNTAITGVKDKSAFLRTVIPAIKRLMDINGLLIMLTQPPDDLSVPFLLHLDQVNPTNKPQEEPLGPVTDGGMISKVLSAARPLAWSMAELMKLELRPTFITRYRVNNVKKVIAVPLFDETGKKGVVFFFSGDKDAFQNEGFSLAANISLAMNAAIAHIQAYGILRDEIRETTLLVSMVRNAVTTKNRQQFQHFLISEFKTLDFFAEACLFISSPFEKRFTPIILKQEKDGVFGREWLVPDTFSFDNDSPFFGFIKNISQASELTFEQLLKSKAAPPFIHQWSLRGGKHLVLVPVIDCNSLVGVLFLFVKAAVVFSRFKSLMNDIGSILSIMISNLLAREMIDHQQEEINQYKRRLENEAYFSQPVTLTAYHYNELVGSSPRMKEAFHLASQVAGTNSSVLILGETGTGKELLARAIHNNSARKDKVMVKVNCATLPANLIESELFGHERGSFTGAVDKRIGKFEMADKSTIFLDEIGELSLSLQAKLLRALQEKEIERIGGKATIKTDIRIIAATNRDLIKAVQEGSFRSDLYFRLNVFPITLPALRERKEDIPTLANHFAAKYSKKLNSGISYFTSTAMKQLMAYNWPGNVRELEHLVQRSILLSKGKKVSHLLLQGMNSGDVDQPLLNRDVKTIDEVERAHILSVLKMVNGKVSGIGGAAEILKIPATTLSSKMIRLKIKKGIS